MRRGESFITKSKCKNNHCSAMSNSACCDLKSKGDLSKFYEKFSNHKCNCQKIITFTPHHYVLEGGSIKSKLRKISRRTQTAWNRFLKPANNATAPSIGMAVTGKTKNPKVGQATTNFSKLISGGKTLSLTDVHGDGMRLKVLSFHFKDSF